MALLVWPPPAPSLPTTSVYPANLESAADTLALAQVGGPDVWGRAGLGPDPELTSWIDFALGNDGSHPYGSWVNAFRWLALTGLSRDDIQPPYIAVELRTAAEIHAASGDPDAFGFTAWSGTAGLPPMDGLTEDGRDISWWSGNPTRNASRFIRVLLREDLAAGGAGALWSGKAFFIESLIHEFGHVTQFLLADIYGADFVVQNTCDLFGKPTSDWDDAGLPWRNRVIEMAAEMFKDTAFPRRRYNNRTAGKLDRARFDDWLELMFKLPENPYWDAGNIDALRAKENTFFANLGIASFVHEQLQAPCVVINTTEASAGSYASGSSRRVFEWDGAVLPTIAAHYNFDPTGTPADPGDGYRWDDIQGMGGDRPGYPVYDFNTEAGWTGDAGNRVRWGFSFDIYTLDRSFINPGTLIGSAIYPLWPPAGYVGDPDMFIPAIEGSFTLNASDIVFSTGFTALPAQGFQVWPTIIGVTEITQPKYTLFPSEPTADENQGLSVMWPWLTYIGRRATFYDVTLPWPYIKGFIQTGLPLTSVQRPDIRISNGGSVRSGGPVIVAVAAPAAVLNGSQMLGNVGMHDTGIEVVSTVGLPPSGEVRINSGLHEIIVSYESTTPTTLVHPTYLSGHLGEYPDGSYVFIH